MLNHLEGHAESCACVRPGDNECNCHKAYGFETADAMDEAVEYERALHRVAKALYEAQRYPVGWSDACSSYRRQAFSLASVAIAAFRGEQP